MRGTTAKLVLSAGRVAIAGGASSVLLVAVAVITARVLGPSGRGALVLVATTATYLMLVTSLGIPISGRVMLGTGDRRTVLSHYLGLGLFLSMVQIVLTAILAWAILIRSGVPLTLEEDLLVGLYGGGLVVGYLLVHGLYGIGLNEQAAIVQVGGAAVQLLLVIVLGSAAVASPWPYVAAMLFGTLGQIVASLIVLAFGHFLVWPSFSLIAWQTLIVRGVPAIGLSLGQAAVLRLDRLLIGLFLSASAVGVYSVAATATDIVFLVPAALSQVLFQKIASKTVDLSTAHRARTITLLIGVVTALVIYLLAPLAIDRLVGPRFAGAVVPLRILLLAALFLSSYQIDAYALAARGQIWLAGSATLLGFAVILVADLLLIPTNGIVGAAWASAIAYGLMAVLVRLIVIRVESAPAESVAAV
jgi:O-antigen/teichoic acid export membrane protein